MECMLAHGKLGQLLVRFIFEITKTNATLVFCIAFFVVLSRTLRYDIPDARERHGCSISSIVKSGLGMLSITLLPVLGTDEAEWEEQ